MTNTGNIDYKKIQDKQYLTVDTDKGSQIVSELSKQNIPYSARYDEAKISLTFSKADFDKVNEIISSTQPAPNEPVQSAADKALEEIQRQLREMQEHQKRMEELAEEEKRQHSNPEQQTNGNQNDKDEKVRAGQENVFAEQPKNQEMLSFNKTKESLKLLPILNGKVIRHSQRLDTVSAKRAARETKIVNRQTKIQCFNAKAERLDVTNSMLRRIGESKNLPIAVKSGIQSIISLNERRVTKLREKKIPKFERKIDVQNYKIQRLDRKSAILNCKINRCKSLNGVIKSFAILDGSERHKQFTTSMDSLHKSSVELLNQRIENCSDKILRYTKLSRETDSATVMYQAQQKLLAVKEKKQKLVDKRNKLAGVIIPFVEQPADVVDKAMAAAEKAVDSTLNQENVTVSKLADKVLESALPALPEHSLEEPKPDYDETLLPEIAEVMDMSVSELESKPADIKQMLILDYTNNYMSDPKTIQESLSAIISPNRSVEDNLKHRKGEDIEPEKKENPLKSAEELIEGNANMIDGIINNLPPAEVKQEEHQENKVFTFSRKQLNNNANKVKEQPSEQKSQDKEPPNHGSL